MVRGIKFSQPIRELLVYHFAVLDHSPEFVLENIFLPDGASIRHLASLKKTLRYMNNDQSAEYIEGKVTRETLLEDGSEEMMYLEGMLDSNRFIKIRQLTHDFYREFFPAFPGHLPSLSTCINALKRHNSRKRIDWLNVHKDPIAMVKHMKEMEHVTASRIVSIDGMVQSAEDFHRRYGWAPKGEELHARQLFIGGAKYAVHAAMSEDGFIRWIVFGPNEDVTDEHVRTFLVGMNNMPLNAYGILDNASNQRTETVREAMSDLFDGYYRYLPAYSLL